MPQKSTSTQKILPISGDLSMFYEKTNNQTLNENLEFEILYENCEENYAESLNKKLQENLQKIDNQILTYKISSENFEGHDFLTNSSCQTNLISNSQNSQNMRLFKDISQTVKNSPTHEKLPILEPQDEIKNSDSKNEILPFSPSSESFTNENKRIKTEKNSVMHSKQSSLVSKILEFSEEEQENFNKEDECKWFFKENIEKGTEKLQSHLNEVAKNLATKLQTNSK